MVVIMRNCVVLTKVLLCAAMAVGSIAVAFEDRSELMIAGGHISYARLHALGRCRVILRTVPVSEVDCIDMRPSGHLRGQGPREMLYVRLKNGVKFYNEREGGAYNTQLVVKLEKALKGDGMCVVRHFNGGFIFLSVSLLVGSIWFAFAIFGKAGQIKDFLKKLCNRYPDSRNKEGQTNRETLVIRSKKVHSRFISLRSCKRKVVLAGVISVL